MDRPDNKGKYRLLLSQALGIATRVPRLAGRILSVLFLIFGVSITIETLSSVSEFSTVGVALLFSVPAIFGISLKGEDIRKFIHTNFSSRVALTFLISLIFAFVSLFVPGLIVLTSFSSFVQGERLLVAGKYDQSLAAYQSALQYKSGPIARFTVGRILSVVTEEEELFIPVVYFEIGRIQSIYGQYSDAIKTYSTGLLTNRCHVEFNWRLGELYRFEGDLRESLAVIDAGIETVEDIFSNQDTETNTLHYNHECATRVKYNAGYFNLYASELYTARVATLLAIAERDQTDIDSLSGMIDASLKKAKEHRDEVQRSDQIKSEYALKWLEWLEWRMTYTEGKYLVAKGDTCERIIEIVNRIDELPLPLDEIPLPLDEFSLLKNSADPFTPLHRLAVQNWTAIAGCENADIP